MPISVTPVEKNKYTRQTAHTAKDEDEPAPSQEQEVPEILEMPEISLSLSELCDTQKDYSCLPNEPIVAWLLQCWDMRANGLNMEGRHAKLLESLTREAGIYRDIERAIPILSLCRWLLVGVKGRYCTKDDIKNHPGRWTAMKKDIQYLRELTVLEKAVLTVLEKGGSLEHLHYIDNIIVWDERVEEDYEKGKNIIQILLKAGFTIKQRSRDLQEKSIF